MKRTSVPALAVSLLLAFSASLALGCSGGAGDTGDAEAQAMGDKQLTELTRLMAEEPQIDPADLGRLGMPVLVIAGSDDMVEGEHTRLIAGSIPGAELKTLDGTHFVAFERPDEFNEAVAGFLSRADQAE